MGQETRFPASLVFTVSLDVANTTYAEPRKINFTRSLRHPEANTAPPRYPICMVATEFYSKNAPKHVRKPLACRSFALSLGWTFVAAVCLHDWLDMYPMYPVDFGKKKRISPLIKNKQTKSLCPSAMSQKIPGTKYKRLPRNGPRQPEVGKTWKNIPTVLGGPPQTVTCILGR